MRLDTQVQLLPLYSSVWKNEKAELDEKYMKELEQVLRFDLSHNGSTALLPFNPGLENGTFEQLRQAKVFYAIQSKVHEKKLYVQLHIANTETIKAVDPIPLTGTLAQDRRKIHKLADTLYKELFDEEGIASSRFLYTVKTQEAKNWSSDIWEADYDGANARQVARGAGYSVTPAYLSKTSYLYVSYLNGQPKIFIGSLENGSTKRLTLMRGNQFMPAISRQKDKIAFISDVTGNPDLFLQPFSPQGAIGKPQQIFAVTKTTQGTPTFSPNGKKIAFVSNKDGSPRIYLIDIPLPGASLKGINAQLISKQSRESTAPAWSPDGTKLVYSALTDGVRQIWIYDFEKREERQITEGAVHKENPAWAANSLHLIYNSTGPSGSELYLINLNQPQAHKISSGPGEKRFPSWGY